ncbi:MAG: bifunctional DNA-formamidopyrimidine glycosylase/DNA-(apurinic or apyrimidinic site) lyase [Alphaproteobacteria bacterium]|nr:bifunctional DNA-formamidopyrimidine glycosylase/DNA-(apurinic or apyrimidinic site) lyase [Alphaproteobacteria bacterium]
MPELPEVETTRAGLAAALTGRRIAAVTARRSDLRFALPDRFAERLAGRTVTAVGRRAKFLLLHLDDGTVLIAHLGMSGRFKIFEAGETPPPPGPHDHILFEVGNGTVVRFCDPRRFGFMDLTDDADTHRMLRDLGPEPLEPGFTAEGLDTALAGRRGPIKTALLDQRIVAGLGNIYVCEALYMARISPRRRAGSVPGARSRRLVPAIRSVLADAIAAGGSSLRDFQHTDGRLGYFQTRFAVYGRAGKPCPACPGNGACVVRRIAQSGRSTFYCPIRQR